jgi:hypothetical protein
MPKVEYHDLGDGYSVMFHKDGRATFVGPDCLMTLSAQSVEILRKIVNRNYKA